jgi:hypothetical protein
VKAKRLGVLEGSYTALRAVGEELVRRYAPPDVARWSGPVCGPSAKVAGAASSLQRLDVPPAAIQAEGCE